MCARPSVFLTGCCTTSAHLLLRTFPNVRCLVDGRTTKASSMSHRFTIDALKELITARRDAEQGLRLCIEHVRDRRLGALLMSHLHECAQAQQELQSLVHLLGGELALATQESAAVRRRWSDLQAALREALACNEDGV